MRARAVVLAVIRGCAAALLGLAAVDGVGAQTAHWLDRPLQNWNRAGAPLPAGGADADGVQQARDRCQLSAPASAGARALSAAGWIPLLHLDRELTQNAVEILAGTTELDSDCAPKGFNVFVFSDERFAGTLSPTSMAPRADGQAGPVRFVGDTISAEFARYKDGDATCCPSARMAVRYRIDTAGGAAAVVPIDIRTTRSY